MRSLTVATVLLVGCGNKTLEPAFGPGEPLDVVLVLGCPSKDDGTLTGCQWQRAVWASQLYEDGVAGAFITSGNAVHSPYIEAEAIKAGMVSLGVPADIIYTETQALHTDENAAYALPIMDALGFETMGVASHGGHAKGARAMLRGWGHPVVALGMDLDRVVDRMKEGLPDVQTAPVEDWMSLRTREKLIAKRLGKAKRPSSLFVYTWAAFSGSFTNRQAPVPPTSEPTLRGLRYRDDTQPWTDGPLSTAVGVRTIQTD